MPDTLLNRTFNDVSIRYNIATLSFKWPNFGLEYLLSGKVCVHLLQISDYADFVTTVFYTKKKLIDPADENNRENSRFIMILDPTFPQGLSTRWQVWRNQKNFRACFK